MIFDYPYTDMHELNLDWFLKKFKELVEEWNQVQGEWTSLHDYVQNYFDNLNVQTEIDNKINAMILDGSFATIITPLVEAALPTIVDGKLPTVVAAQISAVVAAQISDVVAGQIAAPAANATAAWLAENVDPDSGYVIDKSLTISGAAADASVVGTDFTDIKNTLQRVFENNGNNQLFNILNIVDYKKNITVTEAGKLVSSNYQNMIVCKFAPVVDTLYVKLFIADNTLSELKFGASYTLKTSVGDTLDRRSNGVTGTYNRGTLSTISMAPTTDFYFYIFYKKSDNSYEDLRNNIVVSIGNYASAYTGYYKTVEVSAQEETASCVKSINGITPISGAVDITPIITENAVTKNQGSVNEGKVLVVGADGVVVPGEPEEPISANVPVRYYPTKKLKVDASIIDGDTTFSGSNWSGNISDGFTHISGATDPLEFNVSTDLNAKYIVTFSCTELTKKFYVALGDSAQVDPYNGYPSMRVGFISDGGKLKFYPASNFDGTITDLKLRKLNASGAEEVTYTCYEVEHGSMISNISGFWNIAIGGPDVLSNSENGARNIGIGRASLNRLKSGIQNIGIGTYSMPYITEGNRNIAIGADSLYNPADYNRDAKANDNVAIGKACMSSGSDIEQNVSIGNGAMSNNDTAASRNVAVGYNALTYAHESNVGVGHSAGAYSKGNGNTSVGRNAGNTTYVTGNNNVCIGYDSGFDDTGASAENILTVNNAIAIGYGVKAKGSNYAHFGNSSQTIVLAGKKINFNLDGTVTWESLS